MTIDITALDVLPESEPTMTDGLVDLDGTGLGRCWFTCLFTCSVTSLAR